MSLKNVSLSPVLSLVAIRAELDLSKCWGVWSRSNIP